MSIISFIKSQIPASIKQKIRLKKMEDSFKIGYHEFVKTGKTSNDAYQELIKYYCTTNGAFNESFHQKIKNDHPLVEVPETLSGIVGSFTKNDFDAINTVLNEDGYITFSKKLPKETCKKINDYALKTGAKVPPKYDAKIVYDPENPIAEIYRFDIQDMVNNPDIQELMMDPVLINVARKYLSCEPIFDFPAMWWSTSFSKEASSEAAQLYHFDMDRIKWLKIFFYINDVDENNGPHSYIKGSHKVGAKNQAILDRGYLRIQDEELKKYHDKDSFVTLLAEAGTSFAGDTKCWHKGNPLKSGHRLVLEFEYTGSLFGANYPKMVVENASPVFKEFCMKHPVYASHIKVK